MKATYDRQGGHHNFRSSERLGPRKRGESTTPDDRSGADRVVRTLGVSDPAAAGRRQRETSPGARNPCPVSVGQGFPHIPAARDPPPHGRDATSPARGRGHRLMVDHLAPNFPRRVCRTAAGDFNRTRLLRV